MTKALYRSLIALFAALCLLGAQQGAAWHQISHAQADGVFQSADEPSQDGHQPHSKVCDECSLYAGIAGGAIPTSEWLPVADSACAPVSFQPDFRLPRTSSASYAARAPPTLL
jgi:hypothetical protein